LGNKSDASALEYFNGLTLIIIQL